MASKLVEAVLRRAILQGGSVGYNPDMYDFGFADNIPPSEAFNNELKEYGTLRYSSNRYLFGGETWSSFTIDERGRKLIEELDRQKDGPLKVKKIIRFFFVSFVCLFCLPIIVVVGAEVALAWLICDINVSEQYSWLSGLYHGLFTLPNYIRHLFNDNILFVADKHTTAYIIFYWISAVFILIQQMKELLRLLVSLIKDWYRPGR